MEPHPIERWAPNVRVAVAICFGVSSRANGRPGIADVFERLKAAIHDRFGGESGLAAIVSALEKKPDSPARRSVLLEELEQAEVSQDREIVSLADAVLQLIPQEAFDQFFLTLELRGDRDAVSGAGDIKIVDRRPSAPDTGESTGDATRFVPPPESDETAPADTGKVIYNPPDRMRVGKRELIEARVAKEITGQFREGLKGRGTAIEAETLVAAAMHLELYGDPSVFDIVADISRPLLLYKQPTGFAEWRWWVTPKKRGNHDLRLRISGQTVTEDGMLGDIAFEPITTTISVRVSPAVIATRAAKWALPLIVSAAIGAVVGGYTTKILGL